MNKSTLAIVAAIALAIFCCGRDIVTNLQNNEVPEDTSPTQSTPTPTTPTAKAEAYLAETRSACLNEEEAWDYIGATTCVRFTVQQVARGKSGTVFLNATTTGNDFSVVSFYGKQLSYDDANSYLDSTISVRGEISSYEGQPQIILSSRSNIYNVVTREDRVKTAEHFVQLQRELAQQMEEKNK